MHLASGLLRSLPYLPFVDLGNTQDPRSVHRPSQSVTGHGDFPQVTFHSTRVTVPVVEIEKWDSKCDTISPSYILLSPHGSNIADNKVLLLDQRGQLVWFQQEHGAVHNVQVQQYRSESYITYWVGDDEFWGHGAGYYKMYDQTYTLAYTLSAGNGLDGDYHEFSITPQNTALITAFVKTAWDLSAKGRDDPGGHIWDCVFQEIDIETNRLLFEWRASDHYHFDDMAVDSWASWTGTAQDPWDWFHLNSVEKDVQGNFLVAARYTNGVIYINGTTGKRLWQLGGIRNSFHDLAQGLATTFIDPHMARWDDAHTAITIFDNVDFRSLGQSLQYSRASKITLDTSLRTANVSVEFAHPQRVFAQAEGSLQKLDNGNYLVAYGSSPVFSEYSAQGKHLCETHWAPMREVDGVLSSPQVVDTYRVYKSHWIGFPAEQPVVKFTEEALYLHWNGATEVRSWHVEGGRGVATKRTLSSYKLIGRYRHDDFEIVVPLEDALGYQLFRLTALDGAGKALGMWQVNRQGQVHEILVDESRGGTGMVQVVAVFVLGGMVLLFRKWRYVAPSRRPSLKVG